MPAHASMLGLLAEIDAFLARHAMPASTFGTLAVNDGKLVDRLRRGGRVWPETEAAIRAAMAGYQGPQKRGPKPKMKPKGASRDRGRKG